MYENPRGIKALSQPRRHQYPTSHKEKLQLCRQLYRLRFFDLAGKTQRALADGLAVPWMPFQCPCDARPKCAELLLCEPPRLLVGSFKEKGRAKLGRAPLRDASAVFQFL